MRCDLPPGHEGDHSAEFHRVDYKDGLLVFEDENARTYWSDMAAVPADQIKPDFEGLAKLQEARRIAKLAELLEQQ